MSNYADCFECDGRGEQCTACGSYYTDMGRCEDCGAGSAEFEACSRCGGSGRIEMPSFAEQRDAKFFGNAESTARLRSEAEAVAAKGRIAAAPIVGFAKSAPASTDVLRWEGAERDVLFVPHEDGREGVLVTQPGADEGLERELPSKEP